MDVCQTKTEKSRERKKKGEEEKEGRRERERTVLNKWNENVLKRNEEPKIIKYRFPETQH